MRFEKEMFHPLHESIHWVDKKLHGTECLCEFEKWDEQLREAMENGMITDQLLENPYLFFGGVPMIHEFGVEKPFVLTEPLAIATHLLHYKSTKYSMRHIANTEPVFINAPRLSGKTIWLVLMAGYYNRILSNTDDFPEIVQPIILTRTENDAKHLRTRINRELDVLTRENFCNTETNRPYHLRIMSVLSRPIQDWLSGATSVIRLQDGAEIHFPRLFLDEYEFYPEEILVKLFRKQFRSHIAVGVSTMKLFQPDFDYENRKNPCAMFLDNVCTSITDMDAWVFINDTSLDLLVETPIQIRVPGHHMQLTKDDEISMLRRLGNDNAARLAMNLEYYMLRGKPVNLPEPPKELVTSH